VVCNNDVQNDLEQLGELINHVGLLLPKIFHPMFRTNRASVNRLCDSIIAKVGANVFKSKEWLLSMQEHVMPQMRHSWEEFYQPKENLGSCYVNWHEQPIYLDVLLAYGISTSSVYSVFHEATSQGVICLLEI
jgi:hypothetical protein